MEKHMAEVKAAGALTKDICNGWFDGVELICERGAAIEAMIKKQPDAFVVGLVTIGIGVYLMRVIYKGIKAEVNTIIIEKKINKIEEEQHDRHVKEPCA